MLVDILLPGFGSQPGLTGGRAALFNYDWMTLLVVLAIVAIGAVYSLVARPARRITRVPPGTPTDAPALAR